MALQRQIRWGVRSFVVAIAALGAVALGGCNDRAIRMSDKREPEVRIHEIKRGAGAPVKAGKRVATHYTVTLEDGSMLLSTYSGKPHAFIVGSGTVIEGLDDGVLGMRLGGKREIKIPPELHWGRAGYAGKVPENSWVTIDVELVAVD